MLLIAQAQDTETTILDWITEHPYFAEAVGLLVLGLLAALAYLVAKRVLLAIVGRIVRTSTVKWDDQLLNARVFERLAYLAPVVAVYLGLGLIGGLQEDIVFAVRRIALAIMVLIVLLSAGALITAVNAIYETSTLADGKPIKGHLQLGKIFIYVVGTILIIATLTGQSPLVLLSGVGAMTAVLLLIFRDTILSFVASLQLASYDMVRVGDWIEMPAFGADGDVIDIALHTVKIQNWDKTITTVPTHRLISDSFKNWRGMSESGGRRIKRTFYVDMNSIRFLDESDLDYFERFSLLEDYIKAKRKKLTEYNAEHVKDPDIISNTKRLTNVGTLRAYLVEYLRRHSKVHQKMTLIVRQLEPTPHGLPMQIYCFSNDTRWVPYEGIQSDIFDHILSIAPQFDLRVFQSPSGRDFAGVLGDQKPKATA
ncbi:MAG: mechanosensitive ion channel family protein [Gemmatimonadales bacterium]|nr:mechanosensitive ion channel family protein [Gemmatimonadales bacterium]